MDRKADQGRRAVHGIFPANYVTLQQLKDKKEKKLQRQKEEDDEKKKQQEEEREKQVQRQTEEEEKKKNHERERRKLKEPSIRTRSSLPPNYVTLQQLKDRKEQNLHREEEDGRNKQEEEENNKIGEQSLRPRRNGSGSGNKDPSDLGLEESTREDLEKKNLQQAAKNGCRETIAALAKNDPGRRGRWGRDGDRKAFTGSVRESPVHQKNGGAPSDGYPEDAIVKPCVEKVWHGKASIGESAMKGSSDSESQRTNGNGVTHLRNKGSSATGKIAQSVSKGERVTTEAVGLVAEGTSVTAIAVTVATEEIEGETKNEKGKERQRPFRRRTKKKPQNQAQTSADSVTATLEEEAPAVVPVTENVLADEDRQRDGERGTPEKQKEKKGEGSVWGLRKDLARKTVLAALINERQRRSWSRDSEKRASLMWVKKGEIPGN